jgi:hypothetical protein
MGAPEDGIAGVVGAGIRVAAVGRRSADADAALTGAPVQTLPSSQEVPSSAARWTQPAAASQESMVQELESSQLDTPPGTQLPSWQASPLVQTLPSEHAAPFVLKAGRELSSRLGFDTSTRREAQGQRARGPGWFRYEGGA